MGSVSTEIVAVPSGTSKRLPVRRQLKIAPRCPRCTLGTRCELTGSRPKQFYLGARWRFIQ
jgi:hypothetical protein